MLKTIEVKITYESDCELSFTDGFDDCVSEFLNSIEVEAGQGVQFSSLINKREADEEEKLNYLNENGWEGPTQ